ncbi:hypothetical protein THAOC_04575, partial [Thalassiosira oceanica]
QKHQTKNTDALLFGESQKLTVEESRLRKEPDTRGNKLLIRAVQKLGLREYERYKRNLLQTAEYATEYVKDSVSDEVTCTIVRSTRHPDAPPRYLRKGERCDCKDRIAEQDMCVHEICYDGFDRDKFLSRHLRRDRVSGSLEDESQEMSIDFSAAMGDGSGDPDLSEEYLPDRSAAVKPLGKKEVQSVLSTAIASYNGVGVEKKFQMSLLVLQMEKLLTNDSNSMVVESGGRCLMVPSEHMQRTQKRERLKSGKEISQVRKKKHANEQMQKLSVSVQNRGLGQVVSGKLQTAFND